MLQILKNNWFQVLCLFILCAIMGAAIVYLLSKGFAQWAVVFALFEGGLLLFTFYLGYSTLINYKESFGNDEYGLTKLGRQE